MSNKLKNRGLNSLLPGNFSQFRSEVFGQSTLSLFKAESELELDLKMHSSHCSCRSCCSPLRDNAFGDTTSTIRVDATDSHNVNGLLNGRKWQSNHITYGFTDNFANDYESDYANYADHAGSFKSLNDKQRDVTRSWLAMYENVSDLNFTELTGASDRDAIIRLGLSEDSSTAYAYYPSSLTTEAGDVWFNVNRYNNPVIGNYAFVTLGHELGHSLGIKHGHEERGVSDVALDHDHDSTEFSIMTYRAYVGQDIDTFSFYTHEPGSFPQSLMMHDIQAVQELYGANFDSNSNNSTYTFSATTGEMYINGVGQGKPHSNRIFRTVWDGNGIDTYDFANYTTDLDLNLNPGAWSNLDRGGTKQLAKLNNGHGGINRYARGHLFNALQFNGDRRSLIENATGGQGNDVIIGNQINNLLKGESGNDILNGGAGNDTLNGGTGNDTLIGGVGFDLLQETANTNFTLTNNRLMGRGRDTISQFEAAHIVGGIGNNWLKAGQVTSLNVTLDGGAGNDTLIGGTQDDLLIGNSGRDRIQGRKGNDILDGGLENDLLRGQKGNDTILGGAGNDTLNGGFDHDSLRGDSGLDLLLGGAGDDTLDGGEGNDTLNGGSGNNELDGGAGFDLLLKIANTNLTLTNNQIKGQNLDVFRGFEVIRIIDGAGSNLINAGDLTQLQVKLDGRAGNDTLIGGAGDDYLFGRDGDDRLEGNRGNDIIRGGSGNDLLDGGRGNDTLIGGSGNDILISGVGENTLIGGAGQDIFVLSLNNGLGLIRDFADGVDFFALDPTLNFSNLKIASNLGGTTIKSDNNQLLATLPNINAANISRLDFKTIGSTIL